MDIFFLATATAIMEVARVAVSVVQQQLKRWQQRFKELVVYYNQQQQQQKSEFLAIAPPETTTCNHYSVPPTTTSNGVDRLIHNLHTMYFNIQQQQQQQQLSQNFRAIAPGTTVCSNSPVPPTTNPNTMIIHSQQHVPTIAPGTMTTVAVEDASAPSSASAVEDAAIQASHPPSICKYLYEEQDVHFGKPIKSDRKPNNSELTDTETGTSIEIKVGRYKGEVIVTGKTGLVLLTGEHKHKYGVVIGWLNGNRSCRVRINPYWTVDKGKLAEKLLKAGVANEEKMESNGETKTKKSGKGLANNADITSANVPLTIAATSIDNNIKDAEKSVEDVFDGMNKKFEEENKTYKTHHEESQAAAAAASAAAQKDEDVKAGAAAAAITKQQQQEQQAAKTKAATAVAQKIKKDRDDARLKAEAALQKKQQEEKAAAVATAKAKQEEAAAKEQKWVEAQQAKEAAEAVARQQQQKVGLVRTGVAPIRLEDTATAVTGKTTTTATEIPKKVQGKLGPYWKPKASSPSTGTSTTTIKNIPTTPRRSSRNVDKTTNIDAIGAVITPKSTTTLPSSSTGNDKKATALCMIKTTLFNSDGEDYHTKSIGHKEEEKKDTSDVGTGSNIKTVTNTAADIATAAAAAETVRPFNNEDDDDDDAVTSEEEEDDDGDFNPITGDDDDSTNPLEHSEDKETNIADTDDDGKGAVANAAAIAATTKKRKAALITKNGITKNRKDPPKEKTRSAKRKNWDAKTAANNDVNSDNNMSNDDNNEDKARFVGKGNCSKSKSKKKWSSEEIEELRKCIERFGNNHLLAYKCFPHRSERAVEQQFRRYSRKHTASFNNTTGTIGKPMKRGVKKGSKKMPQLHSEVKWYDVIVLYETKYRFVMQENEFLASSFSGTAFTCSDSELTIFSKKYTAYLKGDLENPREDMGVFEFPCHGGKKRKHKN